MWFKRTPRNRCFERQQVLDVKLRTQEVRNRRVRTGALVSSVIFGATVVLFVSWQAGVWALNRLVYENDAFAVKEIQVETDGVLSPDQIRQWAGVRPGDNLMALDLRRIKRDLKLAHLVETAEVERVLPHTLRLRIVEREPVAQIHVAKPRPGGVGVQAKSYCLDDSGFVMAPLGGERRDQTPAQPVEALPAIYGFNPAEVSAGRVWESSRVRAALQLLRALEASELSALVEVRRIDISSPGVLGVTTADGGEVTLAAHDPERQLQRWELIHAAARSQGRVIRSLDLSVSNNVPALFAEASAAPAPAKIQKSNRNRKKHV